jgi:DNA-binding protein HU-beta
VTKADIVSSVADATGLTKLETEAVVDGFMVSIVEAMKAGDSVELRGFGSFRVRTRPARMARNPRTGEQVRVDERLVPVFRVSRELTRSINESE